MLATIQRFFQQALSEPEGSDRSVPTLERATAALLCEVVRADYRTDEAELAALREMLQRHFHLSDAEVQELMELAREEIETSVDHYQFVSLIKQHYDYPQRCELVRMMWSLAYADGESHHLEEHRIRRLAELLHVSHSDFIRTKLQVQDKAE
ncbi:TerB family tellurite resistance protein [Halomonas sp. LR3S48]|uniref:tellurite resistance TerB family protein n=1 Tax=Halomonadaceae TaxID=28256 RepID=UPI0021E3F581|nr:TerB family tellurite resistance protein [Halomonas sp. LR3S48]UYG05793.1 TerB family tellurite resistance protein [Halomonas sp. LR3S48]